MPSRFNQYRMRDGQTRLSEGYFNPIWQDIDLRIAGLEELRPSWLEAVRTVTDYGLLRINEVLTPAYLEIDARIAESAALIADLEVRRQAAIDAVATLKSAIDTYTAGAAAEISDWEANTLIALDAWKAALNLGDAATRNVGTAVGTVAAGDHAHVGVYQPAAPVLAALAGLAGAADKLPYFTGEATVAQTSLTAFARTLLDDVDAATARATMGLGSIATQQATNVSISGGTISGLATLSVNTDALTVDASKRVLIGYASSMPTVFPGAGTTVHAALQASGTNAGTAGATFALFNSSSTISAGLSFSRSAATALGAHAAVTADMRIGAIAFSGSDGAVYQQGATITAFAEALFSATSAPTRLMFFTTAAGSITPSERMRITAGGNVLFGLTADDGANKVQVGGSLALYTDLIVRSSGLPATSGGVRLPNNIAAAWRNGANTDNNSIYFGTDDTFYVKRGATVAARIGPANDLVLSGPISCRPGVSVTPTTNGDLTFEATSNASVTVKLKGSDGTVRSHVLNLT